MEKLLYGIVTIFFIVALVFSIAVFCESREKVAYNFTHIEKM